jgi:hypothetical protein
MTQEEVRHHDIQNNHINHSSDKMMDRISKNGIMHSRAVQTSQLSESGLKRLKDIQDFG